MRNKIALVAGGAGGVGEGVVTSLLKENATVIVPSRSEDKLQKLVEYTRSIDKGILVPMLGSVSNAAQIEQLAREINRKYARIDLLIASLGGWWQGKNLVDLDLETWNRILNDNLTSHFLTVKYFIPLLMKSKEGFYFHINGFSAEEPYPQATPVAMMAAAQKMMVQSLALELKSTVVRVYELILGPMKTRYRLAYQQGKDNWYLPEEIGNYLQTLVLNENSKPGEVVHRLLSRE